MRHLYSQMANWKKYHTGLFKIYGDGTGDGFILLGFCEDKEGFPEETLESWCDNGERNMIFFISLTRW